MGKTELTLQVGLPLPLCFLHLPMPPHHSGGSPSKPPWGAWVESQEVLAGTDLLYLGSHPHPPTLPQSRW